MIRSCRLFVAAAVIAIAAAPAVSHSQSSPSPVARAAQARVEPGDRLVLTVWREPQLSATVMVDARGEIAIPKVGIVPVATYTIVEAQDTIRARLGKFLREPAVEVVVLRRIVVNGEVMKPGVYYVDVGTATMSDAIALAGGISADGHTERVSVVRDGERIPLRDWESSERSVADLRSGDQVVVGRRSWYALNSGSVMAGASLLITIIVAAWSK